MAIDVGFGCYVGRVLFLRGRGTFLTLGGETSVCLEELRLLVKSLNWFDFARSIDIFGNTFPSSLALADGGLGGNPSCCGRGIFSGVWLPYTIFLWILKEGTCLRFFID